MHKQKDREIPNLNENEKKSGVGIRWNLFAFLALFIAFILFVVWVFNVLLLETFYESAKMKELRLTASVIESNIDEEDLDHTAYSLSSDYSICIILYEITGNKAKEVISCDISSGCMIHHMDARTFGSLYNESLENDGEYIKNYSLNAFVSPSDINGDISSTVYIKTFESPENRKYVVFLNAELAPVSATVKTYMLQFRWICLILLFGALVLTLLMSKVISTPIIKLSRSVKRFAKGDYDVVFDGSGYREIHELSDALNYASDELSKNDRLQKELIANISHDLRTPLTMIRGYSEMMRDIPGENTVENAQIVIDETTRLSQLVGDMLDLSKIRSGARKPENELFDLTETVKATMQRYEKLTERDGYNIKFESNGSAFIFADRTMMLQVVYNLINNAINYTGDDKNVMVSLTTDGSRVRFAVKDTGDGIAPESLGMIWDRYYKVDKVHRRAAVGTGLGLSIVKSILEAHKATYGVESALGCGSTFWFELPTSEPYMDKEDKNL